MTFAVAFMNLQLHHVVSDVSGATGLRLVCAIIACAHNVKVLAAMRDFRCKMQVCAATQALASTTRPAGASCGTLCLRPMAVWRSGMTGDAIKSARARRRPIAVGHDARFDAEKPSFGRLTHSTDPMRSQCGSRATVQDIETCHCEPRPCPLLDQASNGDTDRDSVTRDNHYARWGPI